MSYEKWTRAVSEYWRSEGWDRVPWWFWCMWGILWLLYFVVVPMG